MKCILRGDIAKVYFALRIGEIIYSRSVAMNVSVELMYQMVE